MENINFKIEHLDPLGQGVSKDDHIAFIEKTLPGEKGIAEIYRKAKGVVFGRLSNPDNLEVKSPARIKSECPQYNKCRGCQFLHTEYDNEIAFKADSLNRMFSGILSESDKIKIHPAIERFRYRNRVQIHYDLARNDLGLISSFSEDLINAGECLLPSEPVSKELKALYANNRWKDLIIRDIDSKYGFIEVYLKPGETVPSITVNKPYADGGFTQVNDKMGIVLVDIVTEMYKKYLNNNYEHLILDIFGGNGNLSRSLKNAHTKVYDRYQENEPGVIMQNENQNYVSIDLYKKDPVNKIKKSLKETKPSGPDLIIFDPPRAGVKFIENYIKYLSAQYIFYISCDPGTLKRDTKIIKNKYEILEMHLIDLFPGTRHFETLIVFRRQN